MISLAKSLDYFDPGKVRGKVHIVGCGSVGATVAELLVRLGITNLVLWDFDIVNPHNLANQIYRQKDIGKLKVDALKDILVDIDEDAVENITTKQEGWSGELMSGYIVLAVDSIELRKQIVEQHMSNRFVKVVLDFRTLLESAQHYAADWSDDKERENLLKSMQFSHEEAADETPVSACGVTLGVAPTVRVICSLGVANFVNWVNGKGLKRLILADSFNFMLDAF